MKKAAVYTRTGDNGTTSLVSGTRLKKSQDRIALYGEADELNSLIGLGLSFLSENFDKNFLITIQSALFDLGSNFACEYDNRIIYKLPVIKESFVSEIESEIDKMDIILPKLSHFVLPGGGSAASAFHVCRTTCRRLERSMVEFQDQFPKEVTSVELMFINRLSDYFFVLSRFINFKENKIEINWIANKN
jgi:cob(I)alamin adenosyltransferase